MASTTAMAATASSAPRATREIMLRTADRAVRPCSVLSLVMSEPEVDELLLVAIEGAEQQDREGPGVVEAPAGRRAGGQGCAKIDAALHEFGAHDDGDPGQAEGEFRQLAEEEGL